MRRFQVPESPNAPRQSKPSSNRFILSKPKLLALVLLWIIILWSMASSAFATGPTSINFTPINPPVNAPPYPDDLPPINHLNFPAPEVLVETGVRNHSMVAQLINGEVLLVTSAARAASRPPSSSPPAASAPCRGRSTPGAPPSASTPRARSAGARTSATKRNRSTSPPFPPLSTSPATGDWAITCIPDLHNTGRPGEMRAYRPDGTLRWATPRARGTSRGATAARTSATWTATDDGRSYSRIRPSRCASMRLTGAVLWTFEDSVSTCHGRPVTADLDHDGKMEYFLGSEYGDNMDTEALLPLYSGGRGQCDPTAAGPCWATFGSTPAVACDVNHDGRDELLVAGQNLTWFEPRHETYLYVVDGLLQDVVLAHRHGGAADYRGRFRWRRACRGRRHPGLPGRRAAPRTGHRLR